MAVVRLRGFNIEVVDGERADMERAARRLLLYLAAEIIRASAYWEDTPPEREH